MRKYTRRSVLRELKKSKHALFFELGKQWFRYRYRKKRLFAKGMYVFIKTGNIILKFTRHEIISKGRRIFREYRSKIWSVICKKFEWCKKSIGIKKISHYAAVGVDISHLIAAIVVGWIFPPTLFALAVQTSHGLDKFCKCKKNRL